MSAGGTHLKDEGTRGQVILAGGIAGLVSRFCIAPLDVVKIRLQLQTHEFKSANSKAHGALATVRKIFQTEGIRGFWRGNVPAELLYITYSACQFTTYRTVSAALNPYLPHQATSFVAGASAGAAATTATYPLDLLRTRFAAQGTERVYRGFLSSFRDIVQQEGLRGFFRGLGAGVGQIVPYMGLFFATYETIRIPMAGLELPFGGGDAVAGTMASVIAKTGVFPLDLIRKRLQIQGPTRARFAGGLVPEYGRGVWKTGKAIVLAEGWRGLYRGLAVGLVKAAPASAITMWTYERALLVMRDLK